MEFKNGKGEDFTASLQNALDTENEVVLYEGVYRTAPLDITRPVKLELKKGAVLSFIPDFELYEPVYTRWEGCMGYAMHPCLFIHDTENVTLTGDGVIDGNGQAWWKAVENRRGDDMKPTTEIEKRFASLNPDYLSLDSGGGGRSIQFLRPPLLQIKDCNNVLVEKITLTNSPFWTFHPLFTTNLKIDGIKIVNPYEAPNSDGIDVDSCKNVEICNSHVQVGDDGICVKSGSGKDGIKVGFKTENIHIHHCTVLHAHGGGVIGSETAAGIENVSFEDCVFDHTDRGIRIKTRRGRGGLLKNLKFFNIRMEENLAPFVINCYYRCGYKYKEVFSLEALPVNGETPHIENVEIENCISNNSLASAGMIVGLPESKVENVTLKNCFFTVKPGTTESIDLTDMYLGLPDIDSRGLRIRNAEVHIEDVIIKSGDDKEFVIEEGVELN